MSFSKQLSEQKKLPNWLLVLLFICLAFHLTSFFTRPINLVTADLGRHIINGWYFVSHHTPITTNYYSFTQPNLPCVNHHWASGVVFYKLWQLFDFAGLSVMYTGLLLATAACLILVALKRQVQSIFVIFVVMLLAPMLASRPEVRPEGFSYLFIATTLLGIELMRQRQLAFKYVALLLCITQIAWVNCHIFFFLGPFILGVYAFSDTVTNYSKLQLKYYVLLLLLVIAASFCTPFGWQGATTPLTIFKNYGYQIAENQTIFFMQKRFPNVTLYWYTELVVGCLLLALAWLSIFKKQFKVWLPDILLVLGFTALSFLVMRCIILLAIVAVPTAAKLIQELIKQVRSKHKLFSSLALCAVSLVFVNDLKASVNNKNGYFTTHGFKFGLLPGVNQSAQFFKEQKIKGAIFNNYDIGGYLIFHLSKPRQVFVDNRPEAYTVNFLQNVYVGMQQNDSLFNAYVAKYNLSVIWFYRHDATPWGQSFLIRRVLDRAHWAPVYVDAYTIIFLKRTVANSTLIRRFELPESTFMVANQ